MRKLLLLLLLLSPLTLVQAANPNIYQSSVKRPLPVVYKALYKALESKRFYVLFEAHISKVMYRNRKRWGGDYNRNKLDNIRSLVVCNVWYANQVANADPEMLALCPLRVVLVEKNGVTRVLFVRPSRIAAGSKAQPVLRKIEGIIISAIRQALS